MAKQKTIEQEIVANYQGEDGDWVVEKGKVKECKFLKRAVARIEELSKALEERTKAYDEKRDAHLHTWQRRNDALRDELYAMREEKDLWFERASIMRDAFNAARAEVEDWND